MGLQRIVCMDREAWLAVRNRQGIGGSEAAAAVGFSPWSSPADLWRLKTGKAEPKDLSDNPAVERGHRLEPGLRALFTAEHPEFTVEYHEFDIMFQENRPWLFSTLDGELTDKEGRKGILEIKTATPNGKAGWSKWADGKLPDNYYIQTLHQLLATGYDFVRLYAYLESMNGDKTIRTYEIERADVEADLQWLLAKEEEFWTCVQKGIMPNTPLIL